MHSPSSANNPLELCTRCGPGGGVSSRAESIHQHTSTPHPALGHLYGRGFKTSRVPEQGTLWARTKRAIAASDSVAGHGRASLLRFLHIRSSRVRPPPRETPWLASTVRRRVACPTHAYVTCIYVCARVYPSHDEEEDTCSESRHGLDYAH